MKLAVLKRLVPRYSLKTLAVFLLLVTAATALCFHWEAWYCQARLDVISEDPVVIAAFSNGDRQVELITAQWNLYVVGPGPRQEEWLAFPQERFIFDADTGALKQRSSAEHLSEFDVNAADGLSTSELDGVRRALGGSADGRILQVGGGRGTGSYSSWAVISDASSGREFAYFGHTTVKITAEEEVSEGWAFSQDGGRIVIAGPDNAARVYRRRRPEWWWGVFHLTEFWATAAFAALFAWSVWRDRRVLGARPPGRGS